MIVDPIPGFSDPFSSMTHLFCSPIFLVLGAIMVWKIRNNKSQFITLSIFTFGVVFLLVMSGVFHLLTPGSSGRHVLQVLDHAAIFVLIASSFTPIHVLQFKGIMRWGVLLVVWTTAIVGITLKSIYFEEVPEAFSLSLYLGLGWFGVLTAYKLYHRYGFTPLLPFLYGGVAYTLGATLEFIRYPNLISGVIGPHELFHVLVLAGISFHWRFVMNMARLHRANDGQQ